GSCMYPTEFFIVDRPVIFNRLIIQGLLEEYLMVVCAYKCMINRLWLIIDRQQQTVKKASKT
ncbi:hypothetical protein ACJBYT_10420, partial [Streptococcus suis]